jgi:prepilin-type N-terminal cleavage/methylation domain-containing protein
MRIARAARSGHAGFTLLEVMVAALVMGIAVAGILAGLSGAARNAARLTEYDRAAVAAKEKMDELLADRDAPRNQALEGVFDPSIAGETKMGWQARVAPFEKLQGTGGWGVDRIELEVWWMQGEARHSLSLEGFRRNIMRQGDEVP